MNLQQRLVLLQELGDYILENNEHWASVKERAQRENGWFIPEFTDLQSNHIARHYLSSTGLETFTQQYAIPSEAAASKNVGIVMAGNIPLVGFHDFMCAFLSGHRQTIKLSSRDAVLLKHLVERLVHWDPEVNDLVSFSDMLKGCDAYIATGSNNTSRYFDYYFSKYPHIIRKNRTSVSILDGNETVSELQSLADDVYQYFGLGCRNVTKIFVPKNYDFLPLLEAFKKYNYLFDHNKYRNNYDYQLALLMLNRKYYMTNGSLILLENEPVFSPIGMLHYEYYDDVRKVEDSLENNESIQCVVGRNHVNFGKAQQPGILDYADGVDTEKFLLSL